MYSMYSAVWYVSILQSETIGLPGGSHKVYSKCLDPCEFLGVSKNVWDGVCLFPLSQFLLEIYETFSM